MNLLSFSALEAAELLRVPLPDTIRPDFIFNGLCTDSRNIPENALFLALKGETFDAHSFAFQALQNGAAALCLEEGRDTVTDLPPGTPVFRVPSTFAAYHAFARAHRESFPELKLIALTGSCGKTSTKEALRAIFARAAGPDHVLATEGNTNNQFGVPQNLLRLNKHHRFAVIEAGTSSPGEIRPLAFCAAPDAALLVSIGNCHLENLGSLDGVAREKAHLFDFLPDRPDPFAVIPFDSPSHGILRNAVHGLPHATFGTDPQADFICHYLGGNLRGASFELTKRASGERVSVQWPVPGFHQALNATAAAAVADHFRIPLPVIAEGLASTSLPGMRMRVTEERGYVWINDAYNANPDSMRASLSWLAEFVAPETLVLALGDMAELGKGSRTEHLELLRFARKTFPEAVLFALGPRMANMRNDRNAPSAHFFGNPADAVSSLRSHLRPGVTVFLKASRSTHLESLEAARET